MSMKGGYRPNSGRKKGSIPWNKGKAFPQMIGNTNGFKKGQIAWNKGLEVPSISIKMKGNTNGRGNKGRKLSKTTKLKMRLAKLGTVSNAKGCKHSPEAIEKVASFLRGKNHSVEQKLKNRIGQINRYLKIDPNYKVAPRNKRIIDNGGFHSNQEWEELKQKYNFTCPCCKKKEPEIKLTRDHILPLLLGGTNVLKNIQPLCKLCNSKKHTQTIKY